MQVETRKANQVKHLADLPDFGTSGSLKSGNHGSLIKIHGEFTVKHIIMESGNFKKFNSQQSDDPKKGRLQRRCCVFSRHDLAIQTVNVVFSRIWMPKVQSWY